MIIVEGGVRYEVILTSKGVELIVDKPEKQEKPEKKAETPAERKKGKVLGGKGKYLKILSPTGKIWYKRNPAWKESSDGLANLGQVQEVDAEIVE